MQEYVGLLRGININGKNRVNMSDLKAAMEEAGYRNVITYLNSGNLLFDVDLKHADVHLQQLIREVFGLDVPVYIIPLLELKEILIQAPEWWNSGNKDLYDNLIFVLTEESGSDIFAQIGQPTEGLERIHCFENVIFHTFDRKMYGKCRWWKKTAQKGIAEKLTIRTGNTILKLLEKAEK